MEEYREIGFNKAKLEANELAESLEVDAVFKIPRYCKKKKLFEYEGSDNYTPNPEDDFRRSFFLELMDNAIGSIKKRFEQTSNFNNIFGFLYNFNDLKTFTHERIRQHCNDLALYLQIGDEKDICACDLFDEIMICRNIIDKSATPIQVLDTVKKMWRSFS